MGSPCMCGGCARCLTDQGYQPCPDCGAFMGCDCEDEAMRLDREQQEALPDFETRFCDDCGREVMGDFCSACREHERRRDDPGTAAEWRRVLIRKP